MIKQEYWERLTDLCKRRGWVLVAYQNIPKVEEMTAPLVVCLTYRPEDHFKYIVYTFNAQGSEFFDGDYHTHRSEAWYSFGHRVLRMWPKWNDEPVPEDAPEDYFKQMMEAEK